MTEKPLNNIDPALAPSPASTSPEMGLAGPCPARQEVAPPLEISTRPAHRFRGRRSTRRGARGRFCPTPKTCAPARARASGGLEGALLSEKKIKVNGEKNPPFSAFSKQKTRHKKKPHWPRYYPKNC